MSTCLPIVTHIISSIDLCVRVVAEVLNLFGFALFVYKHWGTLKQAIQLFLALNPGSTVLLVNFYVLVPKYHGHGHTSRMRKAS